MIATENTDGSLSVCSPIHTTTTTEKHKTDSDSSGWSKNVLEISLCSVFLLIIIVCILVWWFRDHIRLCKYNQNSKML